MSFNPDRSINTATVQLIISVLVVLGAIFTTWVSVNSRLAILETKQSDDDNFRVEMRNYFKELSTGQTAILIELQNKKDKEK